MHVFQVSAEGKLGCAHLEILKQQLQLEHIEALPADAVIVQLTESPNATMAEGKAGPAVQEGVPLETEQFIELLVTGQVVAGCPLVPSAGWMHPSGFFPSSSSSSSSSPDTLIIRQICNPNHD